MNRTEYISGLIDTLSTLTDNQVKYLYYLVEAMFGNRKSESTTEGGTYHE